MNSPLYVIDKQTGCWVWQRTLDRYGYGRSKWPGTQKNCKAHRRIYEEHRGPIPEGLTLDHLCRNRACVNPDHLEPVTHAENCRRSPIAGKNILNPWTPMEDQLVLAQAIPDRALAELIGRSKHAIGFHRWKLRHKADNK